MQSVNNAEKKTEYNPRWFIWTIVFLVVTGVSLVSYIMLSDGGTSVQFSPVARAEAHKAK